MTDAAWLSITMDAHSMEPLYLQLYRTMRERIVSGTVAGSSALPPTRPFAAELGVSRATVVAAYEQLAAEGYVAGRHGSGIFVTELPADLGARPRKAPQPAAPPVE